jgi:hypothetical protein
VPDQPEAVLTTGDDLDPQPATARPDDGTITALAPAAAAHPAGATMVMMASLPRVIITVIITIVAPVIAVTGMPIIVDAGAAPTIVPPHFSGR